jgi:hypothetical protein
LRAFETKYGAARDFPAWFDLDVWLRLLTTVQMAAPRKHPIHQLIDLAEESCRIMWKSYDVHLSLAKRGLEWSDGAAAVFWRCIAADERLYKLKNLRRRALGPANAAGDLPVEAIGEAEWKIRKLQLLLQIHRDTTPQDDRWRREEIRLMDALRGAMNQLGKLSE